MLFAVSAVLFSPSLRSVSECYCGEDVEESELDRKVGAHLSASVTRLTERCRVESNRVKSSRGRASLSVCVVESVFLCFLLAKLESPLFPARREQKGEGDTQLNHTTPHPNLTHAQPRENQNEQHKQLQERCVNRCRADQQPCHIGVDEYLFRTHRQPRLDSPFAADPPTISLCLLTLICHRIQFHLQN